MSWQAYVDDHLVGSGHVSQAAICGLDGSCWAKSAACEISTDEAKAIVNAIQNDDISAFCTGGVKIGGNKFTFLRHEKHRSVYGKKGSSSGCCVVKTCQSIVVAIYGDGQTAGNCTKIVEKLADHLIESKY